MQILFFACINKSSLNQMIKNAAAQLLTRRDRWCIIAAILLSQHRRPIEFRVHLCCGLNFNGLRGQAPNYVIASLNPT